jgi:hypothetical protein
MRQMTVLGLALAAACGKSEPPKPAAAPAKPAPAAPAAPAAVAARELTITMPAGATAKVKVRVPSDWKDDTNGASTRNSYGEVAAGVSFSVTCDGSCAAADLPGNLARLVAGAPERAATPNANTGDPKLDAVRLTVEKLEEGDLPDGKHVVMRVTKPAGLEGPYPQGLVAVCARLHPAKDRFVVARAFVTLESEKDLGAAAREACKTFAVLP